MPNLVITTECNRSCSYCFTDRQVLHQSMTPDAAFGMIDMLKNSGLNEVRLLGGEPTLHPHFAQILGYAVKRNMEVTVFSNGFMPSPVLDAISLSPEEQCHVMLNLPIAADRLQNDYRLLGQVAEKIPRHLTVGVNIHSPGMPLHNASDFVTEYGLSRVIRLGLAHPRLDRSNSYLDPRHYRRVGAELEHWLERIYSDGFRLDFDCGFVPCMFTRKFLELVQMQAEQIGRRCNPIPDILPNSTAIHCFPLDELDQIPVHSIENLQQLRKMLMKRIQPFRQSGVFRECSSCDLKLQSKCLGGCISAKLLRSHRLPAPKFSERKRGQRQTTTSENNSRRWAIPYVDLPSDFWQLIAARFQPSLSEVYFPISLPGASSGRPIQKKDHLKSLIEANILPLSVLVNPPVLQKTLDAIGPQIVDELLRLYEIHGVKRATLSDLRVAELVRSRLPEMKLTASCLLDVTEPGQAQTLNGIFDVLVPATRILRSMIRLAALGDAFEGTLRLLVNEGCMPNCLERKQHFYEMASNIEEPGSLCESELKTKPWLRLTGSWVLPQHLNIYDDIADEYKLAGRVTLSQTEKYLTVLNAYLHRKALWPNQIGGGPASVLQRWSIPETQFLQLLRCDDVCSECSVCRRIAEGQCEESK